MQTFISTFIEVLSLLFLISWSLLWYQPILPLFPTIHNPTKHKKVCAFCTGYTVCCLHRNKNSWTTPRIKNGNIICCNVYTCGLTHLNSNKPTSIEIMALIHNYVHMLRCDVITYPFINYNGGLAKSLEARVWRRDCLHINNGCGYWSKPKYQPSPVNKGAPNT